MTIADSCFKYYDFSMYYLVLSNSGYNSATA